VHECYRQQTTDRQTTDGRATAYSETNKSSAVAEMGDRLVTIDMGRKVGGAAASRIFAFAILR